MTARKLLSSALLVVVLGGCAIAMPPPRQTVSEDARRVVEVLLARWHAFTDLRALADVRVDRGGQRQSLTGVVLVKAPGSVRFEALTPFGQPFLIATIHDGRLLAYNAAANEAVEGEASAETTARLLALPLEPDDMVAVLSGHAVPPKDLRVAEINAPDTHGPSITLIGRVHEKRVWMNFDTGVVHRQQITGGRAAAIVDYQRDAAGALTGFDVSAGERYVEGTVRYRNVAVGTGVDSDRFTLTLPKDAKTQPIR